jgi:hypothetical protein
MHGPKRRKSLSEPDFFYVAGENIAEHHGFGVVFLVKQVKGGFYREIITGNPLSGVLIPERYKEYS